MLQISLIIFGKIILNKPSIYDRKILFRNVRWTPARHFKRSRSHLAPYDTKIKLRNRIVAFQINWLIVKVESR